MGVENNISQDWVETTLGEVCEIKYGKDHKKLNDGNIPCFGSGGLMRKVSEVLYDKPSVLIPRKGTLTNLFFIDEPFWTVDTLFYTKINLSKIIPKYLFYKLKTYNLESLNVGSAVPSLTTAVLNQFPFSIPNIPEQKAIAKVLTAFDDKIELLQAQNKVLETMAQTIFKEWFGKYQIGDDLPDGWRVGRLRDLGVIICGKTPSKADKENFGGNIPFIKIPDMHNQMFIIKTSDSLTNKGASTQKNKLIPKNSICVSCIATVGLVSITSKDSQTNQQINSIIPFNDSCREFIYFKIKGLYKYLQDIGSGGTATLNVNTTSFSNIEIIIPDTKKLNAYNIIVNPIFDKVFDNYSQIQSLTKTRDTLLPKLMSGQVRVNNLKHTTDA
tara:strand:+ start:1250 stop:2404 length:1155 start_codon:yes stop_codon:yes gene_type:complete